MKRFKNPETLVSELQFEKKAPCDEKHKAFNRFRFWFGQIYSVYDYPGLALNKLCEAEDELTEAWGLR